MERQDANPRGSKGSAEGLSGAFTRQRAFATGGHVLFATGMARPARRALSIAGDPDLLAALGARIGPDPTVSAVWLRPVMSDAGLLLAATRAFAGKDGMATATVAAPLEDVVSSAHLQALVLALDSVVEDPEAWVEGNGAAPMPAREEPAEVNDKTERLLGRLRPGEPRPAVLTGLTSWFFWEGVGALFERISEGWKSAISAAHGFETPPRTVLVAGRADGASGAAEELLSGGGAALASLGALGPAPAQHRTETGAAGDLLRRRLAQSEAAPAWPRDQLMAFLTNFDAPSPTPPQRPRARASFLGAIVGVMDERAVDGGPAAPFGLARAVGLSAFDVSPEAMAAWSMLERTQPSLRGWAALLAARAPERDDQAPLDAIEGLNGLSRLEELSADLAAAMSEGAATPLDSRAFAERLSELAAHGGAALAQAPFALVHQDGEGRWRPSGWTQAYAGMFGGLPRAEQNRIADRLADIEHAVQLGAGEPAPRAAWKGAVGSLRTESGLDSPKKDAILFGRDFLDALADAVADGALSAALFWRRAFDAWVEQQAVKDQFDLVALLNRIAEKLPARLGAGAARRTAWLAIERISPQATGGQREPHPHEPGPIPDLPDGAPRLSETAAGMAALLGERLEGLADESGGAGAEGEAGARDTSVDAPEEAPEDAPPLDLTTLSGVDVSETSSVTDEHWVDDAGESREAEGFAEGAGEDFAEEPAEEPAESFSEEQRPAVERRARLGSGLKRVRADIEQGLGVERSSEREVLRQRDPEFLDAEDARRFVHEWRVSFGEEFERRIAGDGARPWSLTAAAGSAQDALKHVRHLAGVIDDLGKRADTRLPAEIVWAARQFSDLGLDPKERPRPAPAPRVMRQAWAALANTPVREELDFPGVYLLALTCEWLSLEPVDNRARPLVRLFEIALATGTPQMVQLSGGRVAEVGPRTLNDYVYDPIGRDGFDAMDRTALFARFDRLIFFLSNLDWRISLDPREKRARLMRFWRPVPVADIVAPRDSDSERRMRVEDALAALDAPEGFVDRLGAEMRGGGEEAYGYAQIYCSIVERTRLPQAGQLGRLYQLLRRDVLQGR